MIKNERQYRISRAQLEKLQAAAEALREERDRSGELLAKAELASLLSQCESLSVDLKEYEELRSGAATVLRASSLAELPGLLIRARIVRGVSQRRLAEQLGLKEQQVQRYESEEYGTANLRRLVEVAEALGLDLSEVAQLRDQEGLVSEDEHAWSKFPIAEMYRRNWFEGFSGTLKAAKAAASELVQGLSREAGRPPTPALYRQRVRLNSKVDRYALLAWQWRVLSLARKRATDAFNRRALTDGWLSELVRLSSADHGPQRAKEFLARAGICLVAEPHLSHTHLDGAAFLDDRGKPVIAMTLRHDRLDNFWFVLLHELIHVIKHLQRGEIEAVFDDLDADADELEQEADRLAGEALIPEDSWETALARYVRSEASTKEFARELGICPAIVAGRIRNESGNYTILRDLVGYGKVRREFPEASFAQ